MFRKKLLVLVSLLLLTSSAYAQKYGWYTEGDDFAPEKRIRITVTNPLTIPIENAPVVVHRTQLPVQNIPERWVQIVDPNLPPNPEPTREQLEEASGYLIRGETNGHYLELQLDDIDKDGIWDEIFFLTDLKPRETREFYIYIGDYERGMYAHRVHAGIGNYGRHTVPFWEADHMGWKLWYPHDVDLHGKREPMLTAYWEYSTNQSGYYMPLELGTDIMIVSNTFGAGGMCLFETDDFETPSRAFYSPYKNMGPVLDSRFSYDVVYNGPLRSQIRVNTMNWNTGSGFYELEQYYTTIAHKSWSICEVKFTEFFPADDKVMFGCGIRQIMEEYKSVNNGGIILSFGNDIEARIPDEDIGDEVLIVPWQGIGLVVKDKFKPEYKKINSYSGNHVFRFPKTDDLTYEYMIVGGWSFGTVYNNEEDFTKYVETEALKYNNPVRVEVHEYEEKN